MAVSIALGEPPIEIALRKSARAKRLTLRIQAQTGGAVLTAPRYASHQQMLDFARRQESWLREKLANVDTPRRPEPGMLFPYRGEELRLAVGSGRSVQKVGFEIQIPGKPEQFSSKLAAFLKVSARDMLSQSIARYAEILEVRPGRLTLRDTRSRWGSCSSQGDLMFSWRLIMAPSDVLDYVAAHEVAHLIEMNHSQAFWDQVARAFPGYASRRDWLRHEGSRLHAFQF